MVEKRNTAVQKFVARHTIIFLLFIPIISLNFHLSVFHWDIGGNHAIRQAQTQQNILNFYRHDPNIFHPRILTLDKNLEPKILRYEFPLMQWTVAMIFHVTGESIFVTRICIFILGLGTLGGIYFWLKQLFNEAFTPLAGTWAFCFSPVFYYYTTCPMPDNLALFGTIWSLGFFFNFLKTNRLSQAAWSAIFLSLAISAKLPYIIFAAGPGAWFIWNIVNKKFINIGREIRFAIVFLLLVSPALLWYMWVIPSWHNGVVAGILENPITSSQILDYLHYHLTETFPMRLLGIFSIPFLLAGIFFSLKNKAWKDKRFWWMTVTGLAALSYWVYEFNMIEKVHDYYMMPFLPLLYLIIAYGIDRLKASKWSQWMTLGLLVLMPVTTFFITKNYWSFQNAHYLRDLFIYKDDLRSAAPSDARCIMINDATQYVFAYLIDKNGFVFAHDHLPAPWIDDMIKNYGVTYMYSDSRIVDTIPEVTKYIEELVMERGAIKVFKLIDPPSAK